MCTDLSPFSIVCVHVFVVFLHVHVFGVFTCVHVLVMFVSVRACLHVSECTCLLTWHLHTFLGPEL